MKVRRKHINWCYWLDKQNNMEMFKYFFGLMKKLRRGKSMSANRCAYYTLKHFYSTTTVDELREKVCIYEA